jgi:hypothetical protein
MFASLDCMHYHWKNCPIIGQGSSTNKDGNKSIILEAIADQRLWIWHAYFGLPGGDNDLNVLSKSSFIQDFLGVVSVDLSFEVNGNKHHYYLLVDRIYPWWSCFISTIHGPQEEKCKHFA